MKQVSLEWVQSKVIVKSCNGSATVSSEDHNLTSGDADRAATQHGNNQDLHLGLLSNGISSEWCRIILIRYKSKDK